MVRMRGASLVLAFVVAPFTLAGGGCKQSTPSTKEAAGATGEITATVNESGFQPDTWKIPAGRETTMTLKNTGSQAHDWTVLADRVSSQDDLLRYIDQDGAVLARTGDVAPGNSRSVKFRIDDPGSYQVVCVQRGHFAIAGQGTLVVK
ncbi:MAG: cupredoxin domain-containing protein [Polyangiales bacterium]